MITSAATYLLPLVFTWHATQWHGSDFLIKRPAIMEEAALLTKICPSLASLTSRCQKVDRRLKENRVQPLVLVLGAGSYLEAQSIGDPSPQFSHITVAVV